MEVEVDDTVHNGKPFRARVVTSRSAHMGAAPKRRLLSIPIAGSGSGHTRKQPNSFEAVIHIHESTPKVRTSSSQVVLSKMQLTIHATRRTPYGPSRLVHAMSTWSGKNPTCSVPALYECGGLIAMVLRLRLCMK